jgi:hypothetical protein
MGAELELDDDIEKVSTFFVEHGWSDGWPIIPPTPKRVSEILLSVGQNGSEVLGLMAPRWGKVTIEKLAINSVMAGCRPEHFPVVLNAVKAMLEPQFGLHTVQTTTHPRAPLIIVNGPMAKELGMNAGSNCFGPGNQANAVIGRAIRLILLNLGGAWPGKFDRATQGQPSKYTFCIAENEEESPWEPLHVERGYKNAESTVTVMGVESPHNINDHVSQTAHHLLTTIADGMVHIGVNSMYVNTCETAVFISPEHGATIKRDGLSKMDVKHFLFENARLPLYKLKLGGMWDMRDWPKWFNTVDDHALIPIVRRPEDIVVVVAGGIGKHSSCSPSGIGYSVTRKIETY